MWIFHVFWPTQTRLLGSIFTLRPGEKFVERNVESTNVEYKNVEHLIFSELKMQNLDGEIVHTVEPRSNRNLTATDLTFGPQTSFSLILYIGYIRFWQ